jgi:GNAT superfamily N-acetyltransferase
MGLVAPAEFLIRDALDSDSAGFIELVSGVFSEHEGCPFLIEELPDLLRPASAYRDLNGHVWVAEVNGQVAGTLAWTLEGDSMELHRVYVRREHRRLGIARELLSRALDEARRREVRYVDLWTDRRFLSGHRFYESMGFRRRPEMRELHDAGNSIEYHYCIEVYSLRPVEITSVIPAKLDEAVHEYASLLEDAVDSGASIGFLPPLSQETAVDYWAEVAGALRSGSRLLFAAHIGCRLAGSVQLDLATRPNALHRAEVMKLMVHRQARRRGIARLLMEEVERSAALHRRSLLVLDTRRGDPAESLYTKIGYVPAGVIPRYARSSNGQLHDTVLFYKALSGSPLE